MSVTAVPLQPVKRSYKIWLWLGLLAAVALAAGLAWKGTREQVAAHYTDEQFLDWHKGQTGIQTTASGLQYQVLEPGEGPVLAEQDGVSLKVQGQLRDGTEFQPEAPMQFQVGQPMIPGFTEGLRLMRKGSRYRFWLPPSLGYVPQAGQPGNELTGKVLIFDVRIENVIPAAQLQQMMMQQMLMRQQQGGGGPGGPGGPPEGAPQP